MKDLQASLGKFGYAIRKHELDVQMFGVDMRDALMKQPRRRRQAVIDAEVDTLNRN